MINIVQINMEERLQKYLAECGIASRRKCEEYIIQGKVQVNGKTITELGVKVNPEKDKITFEGKNVKQEERKVYILLNKPIGYVTTSDEQFGRDKVLDLVKVRERVVPVGRLDMYTSGALILTNDGDFVYKVTHPKHEITKTYTVTVKGIIKNEEVEQLRKGVKIDDYTTRPAKVKILKTDEKGEAITPNLPIGNYYIQEIKTLDNYILNEDKVQVTVKDDNITEVVIQNEKKRGQIQINKTSEDKNNVINKEEGSPIEGAKFNIYDKANKIVDTIVTDENGVALSKRLEKGIYTVQEVETGKWYILDEKIYNAEIKENNEIVNLNIINKSDRKSVV